MFYKFLFILLSYTLWLYLILTFFVLYAYFFKFYRIIIIYLFYPSKSISKERIDKEIKLRKELEDRLQVLVADIQRHEMLTNHAEHEVKRMEAIVEVKILLLCIHLITLLLTLYVK